MELISISIIIIKTNEDESLAENDVKAAGTRAHKS